MDYIQTHFYDIAARRHHGRSPDKPGVLPHAFM